MKTFEFRPHVHGRPKSKIILIMKICTFILLVFNLGLSASGYSQQKKVTLDFKNATSKEFFAEIQKQTGYCFIFNTNQGEQIGEITISVRNKSVQEVMEEILRPTGFSYTFQNDIIVITPKMAEPEKNILTGLVFDENKQPLPGVTVLVKGSSNGVTTNTKGEFSIKLQEKDTLIFSFIGMESVTLPYTGQKTVTITLKSSKKELEEVVVTGYQVIEKRKLTSAVVSVKGSDVLDPINTSIDQMLQGKIPGLQAINQSGTPGVAPKIRIRGSSSISGSREPVWVVDGVILSDPIPLTPEEINSMDNVNLIGNAISFLNPEDIDRIDILKDASATALYGVRAANGVIVITTKRGQSGPPRVNFSTNLSVVARPNYSIMKQMNSKDRIEVSEEMQEKALHFNKYDPSEIGYEGALRDLWERRITYQEFNQQVKKLKEMNTDWYDLLFHTSFTQSYNLSVSGGNDRVNYYISAGYNDQKGVAKPEKYTRYNALAKVDVNLYPNLKIGADVSSARVKSKRTHSSVDLYQYAYETSRAIPAYNEDGSDYFYTTKEGLKNTAKDYYSPDIKFNIFHELDHSGYESTTSNTSMNFHLDWKLFSMFNWHTQFNLTTTHTNEQEWVDEQSTFAQSKRLLAYGVKEPDAKLASNYYTDTELPMGGILNEKDYRGQSYQLTSSLSYFQTFQKHEINAIAGIEINSRKMDGKTETNYGYLRERGHKFAKIVLENYSKYRNTVAENYPAITDTKDNKVSFYGAFTYTFDNRYSFNFNIRADGSNQFGKDISTRFLPIWSISGRWNAHEELFLQNVKWLEVLAVRGSFGIQGNVNEEQVPDMILTMGGMDNISEEYSSTLYKVPNDHLKWEKTQSYNLGINLVVLRGLLDVTLEGYKKTGKNMIVTKEITSTNGASRVAINRGSLRNKGWELSVGLKPLNRKDYGISLSFNTSKVYNKVTNADKEQNTSYTNYVNGSVITNGKPVNTFYSYQFDKLDANGYPTFKNYNEQYLEDGDGHKKGDFIISSYEEAYARAFVAMGSREPDLSGGLSADFRYKRFSLSSTFAFNLGHKVRLNNLYVANQTLPYPQQNMSTEYVNRWHKPGDENRTNIPRLSDDALRIGEWNDAYSKVYPQDLKYPIAASLWEMYNYSDLRTVSSSFLRCTNLSLNYRFPEEWCKRLFLNSLNLGFSVSNLFVIKDKALKGRDPEQISLGARSIPPQQTYSMRLSLNF